MIANLGQAAVGRLLDALEVAAADELPGDVGVERVDGGIRLTGPGLLARWATDLRFRAASLLAGTRP